jgi:hypothetical protein
MSVMDSTENYGFSRRDSTSRWPSVNIKTLMLLIVLLCLIFSAYVRSVHLDEAGYVGFYLPVGPIKLMVYRHTDVWHSYHINFSIWGPTPYPI